MKGIIINHFFNYEFIYVFLFCSIIFLSISIFVRLNTIRKIAVLLFSVFGVLIFFEIICSFMVLDLKDSWFDKDTIKLNFSKKNLIYRNQIRIKDKQSGRDFEVDKFLVDKKEDELNSFYNKDNFFLVYSKLCTVYKDNVLFRYTKCNENSKDTYVFLGCSFVFGDGVNDDETLPYYFSDILNFKYNILNYGISGKGSNSALNILNVGLNENLKYKHFFFSLIEDLIDRNFRLQIGEYPNDRFVFSNNKSEIIKYPYYEIVNVFKRSNIFRKIFLPRIQEYNKKYYEDYMIQSLEEMNKIVEEKYNSKLTIIVWDIEKYNNYFIDKLKNTNLDLIFLDEKFSSHDKGYRIKNDSHPTAKANKEIAEILYNHINEKDKTN